MSTLVTKLDETSLKEYFREVLDVSSEASLRQLKRARFRQSSLCQSDYLSDDKNASRRAKQQIEEIHLAFDCLTSPRKFREYLNKCNDLIILGEASREDFLRSKEDPIPEDSDSTEATTLSEEHSEQGSASEPDNIVPGPTPGVPTPVSKQENGTAIGTNVVSLRQEKEHLKMLRKKHKEEDLKKAKHQSARIESLKKKTVSLIKEAAENAARKTAQSLKTEEIEDPDQFYEDLYKAAKAATEKVKEEQLAKMKRMDLPVDNNLLDDFATICEDSAEEATQAEFFTVKQDGPLKRRKNSPVYLILTGLAGTAVFLFFINFAATMWIKLPDPTGDQYGQGKAGKTGSKSPASAANPVNPDLALSSKSWQARAVGLAPLAGPAGLAGYANSLEIEGASDYNTGLDASYKRDYAKALEHFQSSQKRNSHIFQTLYNQASLYYWTGNRQEAASQFTATLKLRPDLAQAHYNRGFIFLNSALEVAGKGKAADEKSQGSDATTLIHTAIKEFNLAIDKAPLLAQAFYNRAMARYMLGDIEGAAGDFGSALKLNSDLEAARANLSVVEEQIKSPNQAPENTNTPPAGPEGPQGPPGPGYL